LPCKGRSTIAAGSGTTLTKAATWESGAILGGSGTYTPGGTFGSAGIHIAPGTSIGTLTVGNAVDLHNSGVLDIQVDGTQTQQADKLIVTGDLNLTGSTLNVTEIDNHHGTFTSIQIVSYTGTLTGLFATQNLPSGYTIQNETGGKQILLLPEPATMALLGLGALGMAFNRRRRR